MMLNWQPESRLHTRKQWIELSKAQVMPTIRPQVQMVEMCRMQSMNKTERKKESVQTIPFFDNPGKCEITQLGALMTMQQEKREGIIGFFSLKHGCRNTSKSLYSALRLETVDRKVIVKEGGIEYFVNNRRCFPVSLQLLAMSFSFFSFLPRVNLCYLLTVSVTSSTQLLPNYKKTTS